MQKLWNLYHGNIRHRAILYEYIPLCMENDWQHNYKFDVLPLTIDNSEPCKKCAAIERENEQPEQLKLFNEGE